MGVATVTRIVLECEGAATAAAPARPALITRDMLAAQFERLAAWDLDTRDPRCEIAAGHIAGDWRDFDNLCETRLTIDEIEAGEYRMGVYEDPDRVERLAREKHADALAPLVDAAWTAVCGGGR